MTNEELLHERVVKLGVQLAQLSEKLDDTHRKIEEMHPADRGAATGLVRLLPNPDNPETEFHEFRCEVCDAFAVFTFKIKPK